MLPAGIFPIFQMKMETLQNGSIGWILADEGEDQDQFHAPTFTMAIPSWPLAPSTRYALPGMIREEPTLLMFTVVDSEAPALVFAYKSTRVRLGLPARVIEYYVQSPRVVPDAIYGALRYVGKRSDVLDEYDKGQSRLFIRLDPLDSLAMDRLYLEDRIVFVGVTSNFGPHIPGTLFATIAK